MLKLSSPKLLVFFLSDQPLAIPCPIQDLRHACAVNHANFPNGDFLQDEASKPSFDGRGKDFCQPVGLSNRFGLAVNREGLAPIQAICHASNRALASCKS